MAQEGTGNPVAQAAALDSKRARYEFTIPEKMRRWPTDPRVVELREITLAEEMAAAKAAGAEGIRYVYEGLKHSVVSADGKPITWDAGGKEQFLEGCSPTVRELLTKAFGHLHQPPAAEADDFLASMALKA